MRYVRVRLIPPDGAFNPGDRFIVNEPRITHRKINHINQLVDGTVIMLHEFDGDPERVAEIYEAESGVLSHDIIPTDDGFFVYSHEEYSPNGMVTSLFNIIKENEIIIDMPVEYTKDGELLVTVIGEQSVMQDALSAVPSEISTYIESIGDYKPDGERLFSLLTESQKQTLEIAVEKGYFEEPRQVTAKELAEEFDVSASAVSSQLRRIEAVLFDKIVP